MKRAAGFTLLEVLVALVVFGLLMAGLSQGVRVGLRAWSMQARQSAQWSDLDAVDRTLRGLIARMDPGGQRRDPLLRGGPHAFAFTTELPQAAAARAPPAPTSPSASMPTTGWCCAGGRPTTWSALPPRRRHASPCCWTGWRRSTCNTGALRRCAGGRLAARLVGPPPAGAGAAAHRVRRRRAALARYRRRAGAGAAVTRRTESCAIPRIRG